MDRSEIARLAGSIWNKDQPSDTVNVGTRSLIDALIDRTIDEMRQEYEASIETIYGDLNDKIKDLADQVAALQSAVPAPRIHQIEPEAGPEPEPEPKEEHDNYEEPLMAMRVGRGVIDLVEAEKTRIETDTKPEPEPEDERETVWGTPATPHRHGQASVIYLYRELRSQAQRDDLIAYSLRKDGSIEPEPEPEQTTEPISETDRVWVESMLWGPLPGNTAKHVFAWSLPSNDKEVSSSFECRVLPDGSIEPVAVAELAEARVEIERLEVKTKLLSVDVGRLDASRLDMNARHDEALADVERLETQAVKIKYELVGVKTERNIHARDAGKATDEAGRLRAALDKFEDGTERTGMVEDMTNEHNRAEGLVMELTEAREALSVMQRHRDQALKGNKQLREQRDEAQGNNRELSKINADLVREAARLDTLIKYALAETKRLQDERSDTNFVKFAEERDAALADADRLEAELEITDSKFTRREIERDGAMELVKRLKAELTDMTTDRDSQSAQRKTWYDGHAAVEAQRNDLQAEIDTLQSQAVDGKDELQKLNRELDTPRARAGQDGAGADQARRQQVLLDNALARVKKATFERDEAKEDARAARRMVAEKESLLAAREVDHA